MGHPLANLNQHKNLTLPRIVVAPNGGHMVVIHIRHCPELIQSC